MDNSRTCPSGAPLLRIGRYRLRFRELGVEQGSGLLTGSRRYLGSAWRGAFGRALRETVCVTGLPDCGDCALVNTCAYPTVFENRTPAEAQKLKRYQHTPNPFVLEPAEYGFDRHDETLTLGVTLMGGANAHLPCILHALERAGRNGLTARKVDLTLLDVYAECAQKAKEGTRREWRQVRTPSDNLDGQVLDIAPLPRPPAALKIRLLSPLRIKQDGHLVGANVFGFRAFAANLIRRISLLTYFFGETPLETDFADIIRLAGTVPVSRPNLKWRELTRHSSRQGGKIPMGGLVGSFELRSTDLGPFWPCLWLGQWTHVGKGCTMGLGRYVVVPVGKDGDNDDESPSWPTPSRL